MFLAALAVLALVSVGPVMVLGAAPALLAVVAVIARNKGHTRQARVAARPATRFVQMCTTAINAIDAFIDTIVAAIRGPSSITGRRSHAYGPAANGFLATSAPMRA